jgi:hypothetical protein
MVAQGAALGTGPARPRVPQGRNNLPLPHVLATMCRPRWGCSSIQILSQH